MTKPLFYPNTVFVIPLFLEPSMRLLPFAFFAFLTATAAMLAPPASARSVLLPDDNTDITSGTSDAPNLGILPPPSPEQPVSSALPNTSQVKIIPKTSGSGRIITPATTTTTSPQPQVVPAPDAAIPAMPAMTTEQSEAIVNETMARPDVQEILKNNALKLPSREEIVAQVEARKETGSLAITPGGTVAPASKTDLQTMAETLAGRSSAKNHVPSRMELVIKNMHEEEAKKRQKAPMILSEYALPSVESKDMKESLSVAVSNNYTWGVEDTNLLTTALGYNRKTIPENCQLRLDPTLETTKPEVPYAARIMSGQSAMIKYSGALTSIKLRARAVCHKPTVLPQKGMAITQTADKYSVQLMGEPSCAIDAASGRIPSSITIQYNGDGQVECKY
ncbi:MAG TPA: hypothetical protein DCY07_05050 [Rhodospirillaceae bacterium]|nr:hypothetical protein [Rhodospirillaceae bacterium]